jgi:hypothetical protein
MIATMIISAAGLDCQTQIVIVSPPVALSFGLNDGL